jgi:HAD superfamily hydrolase (TIGR01509 family)
MIEALVFDFDGLIIETEEPDYQTWREIYQSYGLDLSLEDYAHCIGAGWDEQLFNPYIDLTTKVGHSINWDEVEPKRKQIIKELIEKLPILPGVKSYLDDAKRMGLKVGVASSSHHEWVDGHLTRLGLIKYFETIKCADDVDQTKPHPNLYVAALRELDVPPYKAIALEDSQNGVLAAKKAGMYCVVIPTGVTRQMSLDHADLCLNSLAELPLELLLQCIESQ